MGKISAFTFVRHDRLLIALAMTVFGFFVATDAFSQSSSTMGQLRLTPPQVKTVRSRLSTRTGSSGNALVQEIVLHGDPSKPGLYTVLLKVGPNARIAAHSHPDDRMATVVSGTWYFGYGHKFDPSHLVRLPAGSIYSEPAHANHFAMTHGPVIVEITGYGPSGVTYVDAAAAPAKRANDKKETQK